MSKGSAVITIRVGKEIRRAIDQAIERRRQQPGGIDEWTVSRWVVQAIVDKLNHAERSRKTGATYKLHISDVGKATLAKFEPIAVDPPNKCPDVSLDDYDCPW